MDNNHKLIQPIKLGEKTITDLGVYKEEGVTVWIIKANRGQVAETEPIEEIAFSSSMMSGEIGKDMGRSIISVTLPTLSEELLGRKINEVIAAVNELRKQKGGKI